MVRWLAAYAIFSACSYGDNEVRVPDLAPPTLTDRNPDPGIVEVDLIAGIAEHTYLAGKPTEVWAFRDGADPDAVGTVPGPLLEAKLGDRVIVHFKNDLPEETTIHWHGLRVPNASDGTPFAQLPVAPGGTFDYEFTLIDSGYYWYHPHMRGDVQVEAGLYAPIVVHDDVAIDVAADRVFVLDDVKLESSGRLSQDTDNLDLMLGRQGNVLLVNGRADGEIASTAGSRERWRFVNAANGRYFNLELPGRTFQVIGWDGGLIETPYETERVLVAPGERYEVLVDIGGTAGETLQLQTVHYDRGHNLPDPGPKDLLQIGIGGAGTTPAALPSTWGALPSIPSDGSTPRRRFTLREDDSVPGDPFFTINNEKFPTITPVRVSADGVEIWEIENMSEMDHPFHLHGMSFQLLTSTGQPVAPLGWKDTVNVPLETTVQFAVKFGAAGRWAYHCHILEHAERGMMGELEVAP